MKQNVLYEVKKPPIAKVQAGFTVLIASRSPDALTEIKQSLAMMPASVDINCRLISNGHSDPLYGLERLPDLLIFRIGDSWQAELESLCARPHSARVPTVIVSANSDSQAMRLSMNAGARDFFPEPVEAGDLQRAVEQLYREILERQGALHAHLTVVMNAKGGSGASLIATNLAHQLALSSPKRVVLVDLDLQFGSLSHYLDLNPQRGIKQALENVEDLDSVALAGYLASHVSGLKVLSSESDRLLLNEEVSADQLLQLFKLLGNDYQQLVVDLPRQIDLTTTTVLERADQVVLVLQQGITHLRDAARLIEVMRRDLDIPDHRILVVLNRYDKAAPISINEVAKALKHHPILTVPNDFKHVCDSLNDGIPLQQMARRAPITKALHSLSEQVSGEGPAPRSGLLGKLVGLVKGD
ncbi:Type II/IV secretion system ATPase TadZ/CpaE, associated with Flp pilus assembly [Marinobacterium lacunae]|uniref:Type II/IV secretion system ATPase TadZ/CpaE, associated with Flp pilus assembly n=1 Tax=Marinobacterium lacunae TaxID=1232683 RepID=A0A081G419_9GAMM|nr:AAA family ATPase [Marinobacterium lacunae]KEA65524.1 Type II/IV secretion system ATPase TadZ/CpaE, associated with Flp pilus assembly [Marinobacterium lacunae]MBR9885637.1 AAA family ATPase [Oceanospirillales bacterium]